MDAVVGESYVSRTHTDRSNIVLDEGGSNDKNTRKNIETSRRQPGTTYGVSGILFFRIIWNTNW